MASQAAVSANGVPGVEAAVRAVEPGALLVEPRLLRRLIKQHHRIGRLGLQVPHDRCIALPRDALQRLPAADRLGHDLAGLPDPIVLLQRPAPDPLDRASTARALTALWRGLFHTRVHLAFEQRLRDGLLTLAAIRGRIHRIGQTEFDEIRLVLRQDDLLLPPHGDPATYVEFAALYLELRYFDEGALRRFFPTLRDLGEVDEILREDVDGPAILERTRPAGAARDTAAPGVPDHRAVVTRASSPVAVSEDAAAQAEQVGNVVRAAILTLGAQRRSSPEARDAARQQMTTLAERLAEVVGFPPVGAPDSRGLWVTHAADTLLDLAEVAAARGGPRRTVEARLLHDLQKAVTEDDVRTVDVVGWALSAGRRAIVRSLPALRVVRIARHLRSADTKLARVHLAEPERRRVAELIHAARQTADSNVRAALAPRLVQALDEVGFRPRNVPEDVARRKLISELLDQVIERGTLSLGHLRDAVSRNNLKLPPLRPGELLFGDQLLRADRLLADVLDGVYRRGDIYMRFLQKVGSLLFGTFVGRQATRYLLLPLLGAFVVLEGLNHLLGPVAGRIHGHQVHVLTRWSLIATAAALFALIHSPTCRRIALTALRGLRFALVAAVVRVPRWLWTRPLIRRLAAWAPVRMAVAYVVTPALLSAPPWLIWRTLPLDSRAVATAQAFTFVVVSLLLNTRPGRLAQEAVTDAASRTLHQMRTRILPGLLRLILEVFQSLVDRLERALYAVDEWLRFRRGENVIVRVGKGGIGVVWFFASYLLRIYVNLLIEPQVNPIKHFPVVTVSHKIILPLTPTLVRLFRVPLMPLGPVIANSVAAATVVLLPGVFGFLVWEFKENWKLYRGARGRPLGPVRVGHHGEPMVALLRPGFHSGTVPKLYTKLRRASWRGDASVGRHQEAVHHTATAIKRMVEREWVGLMKTTPRWRHGAVSVGDVALGSNRVRIELRAPGVSDRSTWLVLEEQSGWIVASLDRRGAPTWVDLLDAEGRRTLEWALAGLYKMAGVQLVREQIEAEVGPGTPYDIADEGLVVWPGPGYGTEIVYRLTQKDVLRPVARGDAPGEPPRVLEGPRVRFRDHPVFWPEWVALWSEGPAERPAPCGGVPLLPPVMAPPPTPAPAPEAAAADGRPLC